jgi:hypothetical protein
MVPKNPIVNELHAVREVLARESDRDIKRIMEAARARQEAQGRKAVTLPPRKPHPAKRAS